MKLLIILMISLLLWGNSVHAREPDVLPHNHGYGEHPIVGGSEWDGGDIFIVIALPVAVAMLVALPMIFDGKDERWPVYKFKAFLSPNLSPNFSPNKFPTRSLCGLY